MHDLVGSWERAGAGDLSEVVDQWLLTADVDVFTLDRDAGTLVRTPPPARPAARTHAFEVAVLGDGAVTTTPVHVDRAVTPVPDLTGTVVLDPWEESWGVYVPDAVTVEGLRRELPLVTDDAVRAAVWNNVKSGFAQALVAPDDVVDLLEVALPVHDTEDTARHTMPWVLEQVLPFASPGAVERVHAAAASLVASLPPGSELQLSAFRSAVRTASDPDVLRRWLEQAPEGIEADLDVRWRVLAGLASLGAVDLARLDDELARQPTAAARVAHAGAAASLPTAEAKQRAWDLFTGAVDVPNYDLEAAGNGLWRSSQADLCAPYAERYFTDLPATAQVRSGWVLALAAEAFFPTSFVDDATAARTRALLDSGALEPAVARRVADRLDTLERKLAVRAAFPTSP